MEKVYNKKLVLHLRKLQEGLASLGLAQPKDVQRAALPLILGGHNTAIQWYTGSGKVRLSINILIK